MNVNFYYVKSGSSMPTTFTAGDLYFDANTKKLYRALDASNIEAFGGSDTEIVDNLTSTSTTSALSANQGKVLNEATVHNTGDETVNGVKSFGSDMYVINIGDFDGTNQSTASTLQKVIEALGETINDLNQRLEVVEKTYPNVIYSYDETTKTLSITTI